MKISKDECDKEFAERKLVLSDEKCKRCEYLHLCPFMSHAIEDNTVDEKVNIEFTKEEFDKIIQYMDSGNFETVQDAIVDAVTKETIMKKMAMNLNGLNMIRHNELCVKAEV